MVMLGTRDRRRIPARGDLLPAFVAVGRRFVGAYSICVPTRDTDTKMPGTSKWIPGTIRARFCSADRRGQNRGSDFVQRIVVAKIAGANSFSGPSRPKSRVRIRSADRRGQNRGCEFAQRIVAAKIAGANLFSGVSLVGAHKHTPLKTSPASWPGFLEEGFAPDPPHPFLLLMEEKEASPQPRAGKFAGYTTGIGMLS